MTSVTVFAGFIYKTFRSSPKPLYQIIQLLSGRFQDYQKGAG